MSSAPGGSAASEGAGTAIQHIEPEVHHWSGIRGHLVALGGFLALTAAFFWPVLRHFPSRILSEGGDGSTFLWSYWHMPRAIARLENPFVTTHLFHPVGANLAFHTTTPLEAVLSWPIARLFGLGVAVNVLQLTAVILSALGAYLLALHVCGDRRAAFFAGAAFAFVPYRFVHVGGHFNLIHAQFLPFGLLALLRLLEQPTRRRAVVLGVVVGLTFLTDFYYTVFLLMAICVIGIVRRHEMTGAIGQRLAEAGLAAVVVALPSLVPMVAALLAGELDQPRGWGGADIRSADLLSWVVPPEGHPWWGRAVADLRRLMPGRGEGLAYPGLLVIGLAIAGRQLRNRSLRRGWVALAVTMAVLAMGPFLQVRGATGDTFSYLGRSFTVPLPYMAVRLVPLLNGVRVPGRFAIMAILALDVLAAVALASLAGRRRIWAWGAVGAALVLTMVEFLPGSVATHPVRIPEPYHRIAADRSPRAVMEVPLQWQSGTALVGDRAARRDDTIFLYYATAHRKPLVSGYVSRYPNQRLERLKSIPLYRQVLALGDEPGFEDRAVFGTEDLRDLGIGFVVYHRDRPQPRAFGYLDGLGMDVLADDGTIIVWKVDR